MCALFNCLVEKKDGYIGEEWQVLAFGFHFGAVPPFLLIFHVFIVMVVGGVVWGEAYTSNYFPK